MNLEVELKREKENVIHTKVTLWFLVYCAFENEIFHCLKVTIQKSSKQSDQVNSSPWQQD